MGKVLVSYFSASGVTKGVAEKLANAINGDLFEIEPVDMYTKEDLNWLNKKSRSSVEMSDKTFRPPIKNNIENLGEYDTVAIGFPVWWYTAPTIINTFIEENDLAGKKIYIFVTSGGSGYEKSFDDLRNTYSKLDFIKGRRFNGRESEEDYKEFIK